MRRALVIGLLAALCACGSAGAATGRLAGDPLQGQEWWLTAVGADRATPPGPGVPLSIVDSGVDATHPEFAGRPDTTYLNAQTVAGGEEWHGTAVASIAAAPVNGVGLVGVYPDAELQVWDASPNGRVTTLAAAQGIEAAASHCPGVINISFGSLNRDPQVEDAVLDAQHNGCLVVAAAGNEAGSGNPVYPAALPHVIAVAATDPQNNPASFSSRGNWIDLAAPGAQMTVAVPTAVDPSGYVASAGTSFAAPIVAAAAAWIWTQRPDLNAEQLSALLRSSAHDVGPLGFDTTTGYGVLDIPTALVEAAPPVDPDEPNDDVDEVKPGALFHKGQPLLTTAARPSRRINGSLGAKDPRDVYRIWVPAHRVVRASVTSGGAAAYRIWGPATTSIAERIHARRRDLRGPFIRGGNRGSVAYVEVLMTGLTSSANYTLRVTASRR